MVSVEDMAKVSPGQRMSIYSYDFGRKVSGTLISIRHKITSIYIEILLDRSYTEDGVEHKTKTFVIVPDHIDRRSITFLSLGRIRLK